MTDWSALTARTLDGIDHCDPVYRPTNFWAPGLHRLLADLAEHGLEAFKSWPTASWWFYPLYGHGLTESHVDDLLARAEGEGLEVPRRWLRRRLLGINDAVRDLDAVRLAWDQDRWPLDIGRFGESRVGEPPQRFRLLGGRSVTRPYLNYLLCLAALSRHVDAPPRSFLEIGGGFGVLGEIVMRRDEEARYVDLDIPPLLTVASYYLRELFGDRVTVYDGYDPALLPGRSAVLPNWTLADVPGPFDVFVNSFSFQEMEPDVVAHYVDLVAAKGTTYVVSLNSREGKPRAAEQDVGVVEPVTSERIVALFESQGYERCATYGAPLIHSAGEIAVLRLPGARP